MTDAIEEFRRTIEISPNHYRAHLLRGWFLTHDGKPSDALPDLTRPYKWSIMVIRFVFREPVSS